MSEGAGTTGTRRPKLPRGIGGWRQFATEVLDYIERQSPIQGRGVKISEFPNGRMIEAEPGSSSSSRTHPFQLSDASEGNAKKIRVRAGTINGVMPVGFSEGDSPTFVLNVGSKGFVYLIVTVDGTTFEINSRTVGTASAVPANTTTNFHQPCGNFRTSDEGTLVIATTIGGSQHFELCGDVEPLWGLV